MKIKNSYIAFILFVALTISGCTTTLGAAIDTWVGSSIDDFALIAGAPYGKIKLEDGRTIYTWKVTCELTFVTKNRIIQSWSSKNCARIQLVPGKWKK